MKAFNKVCFCDVLLLLILSGLTLGTTGCQGGTGEVVAVDATANRVSLTAVKDVAAKAAVAARSSDVLLNLGKEKIEVEPFYPATEMGDSASNLVSGWGIVFIDGTALVELNDKSSGELRMLEVTTPSIYELHGLYLDGQHGRVILNVTKRKGEASSWNHFTVSDRVLKDLQISKKISFTGGNGVTRFLIANSN
jgi:hypothetical protein